MKRCAPFTLIFTSLLALTSCGGLLHPVVGDPISYVVSPDKATVAPGGTLALEAYVIEGGYADVDATVREGAAGGAIAKGTDVPGHLTYVAPSAPGIYHVTVNFLDGAKKVEGNASATIVVAVVRSIQPGD